MKFNFFNSEDLHAMLQVEGVNQEVPGLEAHRPSLSTRRLNVLGLEFIGFRV